MLSLQGPWSSVRLESCTRRRFRQEAFPLIRMIRRTPIIQMHKGDVEEDKGRQEDRGDREDLAEEDQAEAEVDQEVMGAMAVPVASHLCMRF